ncbi:MAG: N-acetyltransferase [Wenzhouxiangella sp.]
MPESHAVTVAKVSSRRDWRDFFAVAGRIQSADPCWVAPLNHERRRLWSPRHPAFLTMTAQAFVARRGDVPVGTISAQVDRLLEPQAGQRIGYFGQFECVDDQAVADALLTEARRWLVEAGCDQMQGPFDLNVNQQCGLLVDGFDSPPMLLMNHAPPRYARHLERHGLSQAMKLYAYRVPPDFEAPAAMSRLLARSARRIRFRPMEFSRFDQEVDLIRELFNDAWARNWGFSPLTPEVFARSGRDLKQILKPAHSCIAEFDGQPAGFIVALPNINELVRDLDGRLLPFGWARLLWRLKRQKATTARVPLMGVVQRYQRGPLGAAISFGMIDSIRHALHRDGIRSVELSWILETNDGMNSLIEAMGGERYKTYAIYQRDCRD